jgi:hypothetical protein
MVSLGLDGANLVNTGWLRADARDFSLHNKTVNRCVDFFVRVDGSFGYKEFRRDLAGQGNLVPHCV